MLKVYVQFVFFISGISILSSLVEVGTGKWWRSPKRLQYLGYEFHIYQKALTGNLVTFVFSSKAIPSTPQHSDSHTCTRPRWSRSLSWWAHEGGINKQPGVRNGSRICWAILAPISHIDQGHFSSKLLAGPIMLSKQGTEAVLSQGFVGGGALTQEYAQSLQCVTIHVFVTSVLKSLQDDLQPNISVGQEPPRGVYTSPQTKHFCRGL